MCALVIGLITFCRSLSEFVDNVSLRSVYDATKRTRGGDMLGPAGEVAKTKTEAWQQAMISITAPSKKSKSARADANAAGYVRA